MKKNPAFGPGETYIPTEIWDLVLTCLTEDPVFLWTTCRRVSRSFKRTAEIICRRDVLPKMVVEYKAATPIRLTFGGFSSDGRNIILRDIQPDCYYERDFWNLDDILSQWRWTVGAYTGHPFDREEPEPPRYDQPLYTIHISGLVNDTELPAWSIDFDGRCIEFDWKAMLDKFFYEEAAILQRKIHLVSLTMFTPRHVSDRKAVHKLEESMPESDKSIRSPRRQHSGMVPASVIRLGHEWLG